MWSVRGELTTAAPVRIFGLVSHLPVEVSSVCGREDTGLSRGFCPPVGGIGRRPPAWERSPPMLPRHRWGPTNSPLSASSTTPVRAGVVLTGSSDRASCPVSGTRTAVSTAARKHGRRFAHVNIGQHSHLHVNFEHTNLELHVPTDSGSPQQTYDVLLENHSQDAHEYRASARYHASYIIGVVCSNGISRRFLTQPK